MSSQSQRVARALLRRLRAMFEAIMGGLTIAVIRAIRLARRERMADRLGFLLRTAGPWLPEHRIGRANLVAAFPEKPAAEIEQILAGVWDNLGRFAVEFAQIDRLSNSDPSKPTEIGRAHV